MADEALVPRTLGQAVAEARAMLVGTSASPLLDARLLATRAFGVDAAGLILRGQETAEEQALRRFAAMVKRRTAGEPVHRILGRRAFYDHEFELSAETLEPRPDTEIVVELAAEILAARPGADLVFADIGTGTGAIGISLLALFPRARCIAVDLSPGALRTARRNAHAAGVGARFHAVAGDYLAGLGGPFDLLVSNPPYIRTGDLATLSPDVRDHDPVLALDGGADGLAAYRAIAAGARGVCGDVVLEIGAGQEGDVAAIFAAAGFALETTARDLGGHARALRLLEAVAGRTGENPAAHAQGRRKGL